jgi:hypothetical protein
MPKLFFFPPCSDAAPCRFFAFIRYDYDVILRQKKGMSGGWLPDCEKKRFCPFFSKSVLKSKRNVKKHVYFSQKVTFRA